MRILLLLATNIAVMVVVTIVFSLLGVEQYMEGQGFYGMNLTATLIICGAMGFTGSIISLLMSKWMAKRSTRAKVIENPENETERWLVETVRRQAEQAGIGMPEVAIYGGRELNAFATGANKNNALVAVSVGLLNGMTKDEVEAVLAHEVSHVANGDMITLTLIQGVVNTFVMFFSRIIGTLVDRVIFKVERGHGPAYFITVIVAQMVLGVLASIIVSWFSRRREFAADEGGGSLAGNHKMIAALERLKSQTAPAELEDGMAAFGISGKFGSGFAELFRSHPPLDKRIVALKQSGSAIKKL